MRGLTRARRDEFLGHIRRGMRRGMAAEEVGLNRMQLREFIAEDEKFRKMVEDAETDATENVEEALYQAAISGSVAAAKAWIDLKGSKVQEAKGASPRGLDQPTAPSNEVEQNADPFAELDNVEMLRPRR